jgi:hypothetical protein
VIGLMKILAVVTSLAENGRDFAGVYDVTNLSDLP